MNDVLISGFLWLVGLTFIASFVGTYYYRIISTRKGIVANPNYRTLHEYPIPRGGGIVFSIIFVLAVLDLGLEGVIDFDLMMVLGVGGGLATLFGFIDDMVDIRASVKLLVQICLSAWILICFDGGPLAAVQWLPSWASWLVSCILLIWMINLYNFIDGIDGMASSGAIYISVALALILYVTDGPLYLVVLLLLLAASCLGFLLFNWPPASIFMGDSGSIFLGYCFGGLIIYTTMTGNLNLWTWLIVFGYFLGDTTMTTIMRILIVKKWYHAHRSHAYQNLARICGSHLKVTVGVLLYHVIWLLPLSIWSNHQSNMAPVAALLALLPAVLWSFKFGPRLSSA